MTPRKMITRFTNPLKKALITLLLMIIVSMTSLSYASDAAIQEELWEQFNERLSLITRLDSPQYAGFLSNMDVLDMRLVFIFDHDQPASQQLAPIVAEFAQSSRIYVKAYAKAGKTLPDIKASEALTEAVIDRYFTGLSMTYPLLVAVNYKGVKRVLSQGGTDQATIIARLKAFYQETRLLDLDTRMAKAHWEDSVEQSIRNTTNPLYE